MRKHISRSTCRKSWGTGARSAMGLVSMLVVSSVSAQVSIAPKKEPYVKCELRLPNIEAYYTDRSAHRFERWGSRIVTPIEDYRAIGPLDRKADSPIWLRTYYPSFKGSADKSVPKNERGTQWIEISISPIPESGKLPMTSDLPKIKEYLAITDTTKRIRLPWKLEEMVIPRTVVSGAFYQSVDRQTMVNQMPTIYCNAPSTSNEHGTCVSQETLKPDVYIVFSYNQKLLPCWAQVEEGVRRVVDLNLNVERKSTSNERPARKDTVRPMPLN